MAAAQRFVPTKDNVNRLIGAKYKITKEIGAGSFGVVYEGFNTRTCQPVAIKLELVGVTSPQLLHEVKVYKELNGTGLPTIYHHAKYDSLSYMVMDLLGPSLEHLFCKCKRRFTLKTVLMLADQMLTRIEGVHKRGFIHRDIKPDNFLIGRAPNNKQLFIVDFGLAKRVLKRGSHQHIEYRVDRNLAGTVRYASINAHKGIEQSRRDDLEALAYCLMYFNLGKLPWQGLKYENYKQKQEKIFELKAGTSIQELCKGFPAEFALFLGYCRNLRFEDTPDYKYIRQLFCILLKNLGLSFDFNYDWIVLEMRKAQEMVQRVTAKF